MLLQRQGHRCNTSSVFTWSSSVPPFSVNLLTSHIVWSSAPAPIVVEVTGAHCPWRSLAPLSR
ncbi:hypothetical protein GQ55_2G201900 [Panicum hallii var. hallii]|uniref:Uncharacterized protein n=1 Tax=Panicum hallii var. hallii TaxID=1504633 RepID=A0A2T7EQN5_9POAL|nr:hypothetical protein GQ55_2G201900 [Panicum hallii var. hallii]